MACGYVACINCGKRAVCSRPGHLPHPVMSHFCAECREKAGSKLKQREPKGLIRKATFKRKTGRHNVGR